MGGMELLVCLDIIEAEQHLSEEILAFVVFEGIRVGLMVIYGQVRRQSKIRKQCICLTGLI